MDDKIINYGFDPEKQEADESAEDWMLGATNPKGIADEVKTVVIALYAWPRRVNGVYQSTTNTINHVVIFFNEKLKEYYPKGEIQRGREDFMDCVARGFNNEIEKQLNWAISQGLISDGNLGWLEVNGYLNADGELELSDRFPAMNSNTNRRGNSMKAPVDAIRKIGSIPNPMLPKEEGMTWAQYHDKSKITEEMNLLAAEFARRFLINYVTVPERDFNKFAGGAKWDIFDNYIEGAGDFIKRLAPNYNFWYRGYQLIINEVPQASPAEEGEEEMTFYRASQNLYAGRIYQLGVDGLYHHISVEPIFKGLYGKFEDNKIEDLGVIPDSQIGFSLHNKSSLLSIILNLFKGLKGKK